MFQEIYNDIKSQFSSGSTLTRLIIINIIVFVVVTLIGVFSGWGNFHQTLSDYLSMSSDTWEIFTRPWTLVTYMFMHASIRHIFWNMLLLFWFGRIVGDFMGDKKILPIYILGGIVGGILYYFTWNYTPYGNEGTVYMVGASGAVMAFLGAATYMSPKYEFNLLLIGRIKLYYITLFLLFVDLVMISRNVNTGGHFAHLGGFAYGVFYVYMMRNKGIDLAEPLIEFGNKVRNFFNKNSQKAKPKSPVYVKYKASQKEVASKKRIKQSPEEIDFQTRLDKILDKIKVSGYDSLDDEEKDFLVQASKKE